MRWPYLPNCACSYQKYIGESWPRAVLWLSVRQRKIYQFPDFCCVDVIIYETLCLDSYLYTIYPLIFCQATVESRRPYYFLGLQGIINILFSSELVFQTYVWVFAFVFLITFFIFSHFNCFIYLTLFGQLEQDSILDSDWLRATMRPRYRTLIGWEWYDVFPIFV